MENSRIPAFVVVTVLCFMQAACDESFFRKRQDVEEGVAAIEHLLQTNASLDAYRIEGDSPLVFALKIDRLSLFEKILATGVDPLDQSIACESNECLTIVHLASYLPHGDEYLSALSRSGDLSRAVSQPTDTRTYRTPLSIASQRGLLSNIRVLLGAGVAVNARDSDDETALHQAIVQSHFRVAACLISEGAALDLKSIRGFSPRDLFFRYQVNREFHSDKAGEAETMAYWHSVVEQLMSDDKEVDPELLRDACAGK